MTVFQSLVLRMLLMTLECAYLTRVRTDDYMSQEEVRRMDKRFFWIEAEVKRALGEVE